VKFADRHSVPFPAAYGRNEVVREISHIGTRSGSAYVLAWSIAGRERLRDAAEGAEGSSF
jgi:hypothetical protein